MLGLASTTPGAAALLARIPKAQVFAPSRPSRDISNSRTTGIGGKDESGRVMATVPQRASDCHEPPPGDPVAPPVRSRFAGGRAVRSIRWICLGAAISLALATTTPSAGAQSGNEKPKATEVGVTDTEIRLAVIADVDTLAGARALPGVGGRRQGGREVHQCERGPRGAEGRDRLHRLEAQRGRRAKRHHQGVRRTTSP